jgi:DNA-binding transcriptional ArsR family regulator
VNQPDSIPEDLLRFLDANVESIEQLEILRLLGESPTKAWLDQDLAAASQTRPDRIARHLTALEGRGLLKTQVQGSQTYCTLGPSTPEIAKLLSDLLRFYQQRPATLIRIVYARADERLKAFADAFRLRKGD